MEFGLTFDDRAIRAKLDALPDRLSQKLAAQMRGTIVPRLKASVEAAEPVKTGKLRAETAGFVDVTANYVRGRVRILAKGAEAGKAAALEYGAHGEAAVKAYSRGADAVVSAYSRKANIVAQRFLRGTLDSQREEIMSELEAALKG